MLLNSKGTKVRKVKSPLVTCPPGPLLRGHQSILLHTSSISFWSMAQDYPGELSMMIETLCVPWTHVAIEHLQCGRHNGGTGFLI